MMTWSNLMEWAKLYHEGKEPPMPYCGTDDYNIGLCTFSEVFVLAS